VRNALVAAFALSWALLAGGRLAAQTQPVSEHAFLQQVRENHPLMRRAATLLEVAEAKELEARGAFDPKVGATWKDKVYDGTPYESQGGPELTWESPLGVGLNAGWNTATGERLDASDYVPEGGLWAVGGTVRLGRGLWTDSRRATLAKAQALVGAGDAERILEENDVLLHASMDYWSWYKAWVKWNVSKETESLAFDRLDWSRNRLESGEGAALDTLEAHWNWTTRRASRAASEGSLREAQSKVERWLWMDDWVPATLPQEAFPDPELLDRQSLQPTQLWSDPQSAQHTASQSLWLRHPYRQLYTSKGEAQAADVAYRREWLKPQVDGAFAMYSSDLPGSTDWSTPSWDNNHRLELKVSMPLFLRTERGALHAAQLAQEQTELDLLTEQANWEAKVAGLARKLPLLLDQTQSTQRAVDLASQLLEAEQMRFELGESSLFLVNSRENALLSAQTLNAEAIYNLHMAWRTWLWNLGQTDLSQADLERRILER
jgi:outer membrane protein TolC